MKKLLAVLMILALMLPLAGCHGAEGKSAFYEIGRAHV